MYLAKNKKGQIGRQIPGVGNEAIVYSPDVAGRRGNVYLSEGQIEDDMNYQLAKENQRRALIAAERVENIARRKAETIRRQDEARHVKAYQSLAQRDPMNEQLKRYFAKTMGQSQNERVINSLSNGVVQRPPDFASDSNRPEIVLSHSNKRPITYFSDFRQERIVGNPLTRDGKFGPAVTDYDRYVQGTDVNQEVVDVAGGTILGRYGGEQMTETWEQSESNMREAQQAATHDQAELMEQGKPYEVWTPPGQEGRIMPKGKIKDVARLPHPMGMGFDMAIDDGTSGGDGSSLWGNISDWAGGVFDKTVDNLSDALPQQLSKELQKELQEIIAGGGEAQVSGGKIVVTRPPTTMYAGSAGGIPQWALYAGLGLMGVGVVLVLYKAMK